MTVHEYSTLGKGLGYGPLVLGTKLLALLARFRLARTAANRINVLSVNFKNGSKL